MHNSEWQPFETIPMDGTPVLVSLEKELLGSFVRVGTFRKNGMSIIGSNFAFDCPKVIGWMKLPNHIKVNNENQNTEN